MTLRIFMRLFPVLSVGLVAFCASGAAGAAGASGAAGAVAAIGDGVAAGPADALFAEARAALDSRQYPKAQKLFSEFIKKFQTDPRAAEARVYAGICDYQQGQVPRALEAWTRVVNMELMQKRRSTALLLGLEQLAGHWRQQNKRSELEKTLEQMRTLFSDEPATHRAHLLAAASRFDSGDYAGAAALYAHAGPLRGRDADNFKTARELASSGQSAAALLGPANRYLVEEETPAVAARLYEEALKRNPSVSEKLEAMTKLGWCMYLQKDYEKAEKLWREVIASAPKGDEWRGRSRWHLIVLNAGRYDNDKEALALCEEQEKEFEGQFRGQQALFARAWLLKVSRNWKEAKECFERLLVAYPRTADCPPVYRYIEECEKGMAAGK